MGLVTSSGPIVILFFCFSVFLCFQHYLYTVPNQKVVLAPSISGVVTDAHMRYAAVSTRYKPTDL